MRGCLDGVGCITMEDRCSVISRKGSEIWQRGSASTGAEGHRQAYCQAQWASSQNTLKP